MTIVSLILIGLLIYIFVSKNALENVIFLLMFFGLNNINIGYFANIGSIEISYIDLLTGATFIICFFVLLKNYYVDKRFTEFAFLLLLVIWIGLFRLILDTPKVDVVSYEDNWDSLFRGNQTMLKPVHFSMQSILQMIRTALFLFIIIVLKYNMDSRQWRRILKKLVISTRLMLPIYIIEAILNYSHSDLFYIVRNLLFGGEYEYTGRLSGLTTEPSYYAVSIFFIVSLNILYDFEKENIREKGIKLITSVSYISLGILSGAFSFVWTGTLIIIAFLAKKGSLSKKLIIGLSIFLVFIFIITNYEIVSPIIANSGDRIENLFNSIATYTQTGIMEYTSEATRMGSIMILLEAWIKYPLIGLGIGTTGCFSGVVSILTTVGVIGLVIWYIIVFRIYPNNKISLLFSLIYILVFLPAGDFELFYGFNIILWIELISMMSCSNEDIKEKNRLIMKA